MRLARLAKTLSLLTILVPVSANAQWSHLGLSGRQVTQLRSSYGCLYACTSDGLYRKGSDAPDSAWVLLGFAGQRVLDLLSVSPDTLIAARDITGTGADTVAILRSIDSGANWSPYQNGFGADGIASDRRVIALLAPSAAPGAMLAASWGRVSKSTDAGVTWRVVKTENRFYFLTASTTTIWAGGMSGSFTPFAKSSTTGGDTWSNSYYGSGDDIAYTAAFDPSDPTHGFIGLGSGLRRTTNNGASWTSVVPNPGAVRVLGTRAFPPLRLYRGGYSMSFATIFKTDDDGASWTASGFPVATNGQISAMLVNSGIASDTLFLGTGSGVLRFVESEIVGVAPPGLRSQIQLRAYPNPLHGETLIVFDLPRTMRVTLRVVDAAGRQVAVPFNGERRRGRNQVEWAHHNLPSGIYQLELRAGSEAVTKSVAILR